MHLGEAAQEVYTVMGGGGGERAVRSLNKICMHWGINPLDSQLSINVYPIYPVWLSYYVYYVSKLLLNKAVSGSVSTSTGGSTYFTTSDVKINLASKGIEIYVKYIFFAVFWKVYINSEIMHHYNRVQGGETNWKLYWLPVVTGGAEPHKSGGIVPAKWIAPIL